MSTATILASAWLDRLTAADASLAFAESAPALFEPEHVETLRDEAARARKQYLFWLRYGGRR